MTDSNLSDEKIMQTGEEEDIEGGIAPSVVIPDGSDIWKHQVQSEAKKVAGQRNHRSLIFRRRH